MRSASALKRSNDGINKILDSSCSFQVARHFGRRHSTIGNLWHQFQQTGTCNVSDLPRQSRGRVTTLQDDRYIRLTHLRDRFRSATVTARSTVGAHGHHISDQRVRNRLRASGIPPHRPYVGPILSARHRRARLAWARAHIRSRRNDWASVCSQTSPDSTSDDQTVVLGSTDGKGTLSRRLCC